jgi:hypothetical protein
MALDLKAASQTHCPTSQGVLIRVSSEAASLGRVVVELKIGRRNHGGYHPFNRFLNNF